MIEYSTSESISTLLIHVHTQNLSQTLTRGQSACHLTLGEPTLSFYTIQYFNSHILESCAVITFETVDWYVGDESVKLVRRILVLVPFTCTPNSDPEWDIPTVDSGLAIQCIMQQTTCKAHILLC